VTSRHGRPTTAHIVDTGGVRARPTAPGPSSPAPPASSSGDAEPDVVALDPVTVATTRVADPGQRMEMMTWAGAGARLAESFPGFLGAGWVRGGVESREWHMLYRFADEASLTGWERSAQRRWWLSGAPGTLREAQTERRTGIEGWFDAAQGSVVGPAPKGAPARWRQMLVIFSVFLPLSLLVNATLGTALAGHVPLLVRVALVTTLMTPVMTYLALPWATRALQWFLDGEPAPWRRRG